MFSAALPTTRCHNPGCREEFGIRRSLTQGLCALLATPMLGLLSVSTPGAHAVDSHQLWLPRNYLSHSKSLYRAALTVEETPRCHFVIAGTVQQDRSSKDHPVFKITCRDKERQTFAYLVDGLSMEILNGPPPPDPEELQRLELQRRLDTQWMNCFQQLKQRTRGLRGLTWLTEGTPEATLQADGKVLFEVNFNAASRAGNLLRYRASCHVDGEEKNVAIFARMESEGVEENKPREKN